MQLKELIRKKRQNGEHTKEELQSLIGGYLQGEIKDYHLAAWLMAVYFRGLSRRETVDLTEVMWKSGKTLPRLHQKDYWIDKHSTGGVGDKVSLILVPLVVAVCQRRLGIGQVRIPMISGRGLGHTGGTLDKLESVPGFDLSQPMESWMKLLKQNDFFMIGQSEELVPADRLLYALRDATATVDCIPLIVSSILSKKLSENLDGLILDVKCGSGAFLKEPQDAKRLALALIDVAKPQKLDAVAVITNMNEPLGYKVGHRLEVEECADFLYGAVVEPGLKEVVLEMARWMVHLGSHKKLSLEEAKTSCEEELETDRPFEIFKAMFQAQGGSWTEFEEKEDDVYEELRTYSVKVTDRGYLSGVDGEEIGKLVSALGGGRDKKEDPLDLEVGVEFHKKVGDAVDPGEAVATVYYRRSAQKESIKQAFENALSVSAERVGKPRMLLEIIQ